MTAIPENLRAELLKLLEIENPITVTTLNRIERIAETGAFLLRAIGGVEEAVAGIKTEQLSDGEPITTAPVAETFGARMIQELMAVLPQLLNKKNDDPRKLVHALIASSRSGWQNPKAFYDFEETFLEQGPASSRLLALDWCSRN
jgi:hypothetical protein